MAEKKKKKRLKSKGCFDFSLNQLNMVKHQLRCDFRHTSKGKLVTLTVINPWNIQK